MKTLLLILTLLAGNTFAGAEKGRSLASIRHSLRVEHARELMGPSYKKSIVSRFEDRKDLEANIYKVVKKRLPKKFKKSAHKVAETIINEAQKHSLDPYFVMAVISGESSFNPAAVGPVGEIGMMQIRPSTGKWMAEIVNSKWRGEKTLRDPVENIKLGVAYLSWLRDKFDGHGQLYLAAYNMGPGSVKNAVSKNIYPKDYSIHVMKRYIAFYKEIGSQKGSL
jgi:soluble lytic murein transglycosylase